jgi:hypothetical protein
LYSILRDRTIDSKSIDHVLPDGNKISISRLTRRVDHVRSPFSVVASKKKMVKSAVEGSFLNHESSLRTKDDCVAECERDANPDFECRTFTFCQQATFTLKCFLSSKSKSDLIGSSESNSTLLEPDERCTTYEMSFLNKYDKQANVSLNVLQEQVMQQSTVEDCARQCTRKQTDKQTDRCLSFAFCNQRDDATLEQTVGQCVMYSQHKFMHHKLPKRNTSCELHSGKSWSFDPMSSFAHFNSSQFTFISELDERLS